MAKRKPPRRMFQGQERASSYQAGGSPRKRMQRVARDHEDVLQNIEFALMSGHRADPRIDDRAADEALRTALGRTTPTEPGAVDLHGRLMAIRQTREDIPDDVWMAALRVVRESVRRHSSLRPGETAYFAFIEPFFP